MAPKKKDMVLKYTIKVQEGLDLDKKEFARFVAKTLNDKRGWTKLYKNKLKFKQVGLDEKANFHINMVTGDVVHKICGFENLSCADRSDSNIYLNYTNWTEGSPTLREGYGKTWKIDCKRYVLLHETGHILMYDHPEKSVRYKPNEKVSVMVQQTIENRGGKLHPWPELSDKAYFQNYVYLNLS